MAGIGRRKKEAVRKIITVCLLVIAAVCAAAIAGNVLKKDKAEDTYEELFAAAVTVEAEEDKTNAGAGMEEISYEGIPQADFDILWQVNTDICAWISIPGINTDYPILRNSSSADPHDEYYLQHTVEREEGLPGAIYIEPCNAADFSDAVTVIYGHSMKNGSMFGNLRSFEDDRFFEEHEYIYIVTPDETLIYEIFGVVFYDDRHITGTYDFASAEQYQKFLDSLASNRDMRDLFREGTEVTADDRIIVLSTCVSGEDDRRLLLCARLADVV